MKSGKVSEAVLKRSIFKEIIGNRKEVLMGAGLCRDSAVIKIAEEQTVALTTDPIIIKETHHHIPLINSVLNDIAASGGEAVGVLINLMLPIDFDEPDIRKLMKDFNKECVDLGIQILGGHTEITDSVNYPIAVLTGVGKADKNHLPDIKKLRPGQDIVMSKYIGLEGTYLALLENKELLKQRFSSSFIQKIEDFKHELNVVKEAKIAMDFGVTAMHDLSQDGIFKALWEIGSGSGLGLEVNFKDIQIKQETVEVTEVLDINPYQILSGGSLLMILDDGEGLVNELKSNGVNAALIGKMTDSNDRVLITDEGKRYLESN